jgi:hypothetical protein
MRLCTFEIATPIGRWLRLGAMQDGRIADLNFAEAWYLAQTGEPDPQPLADALVPPCLESFLRAGLRASHSAEELFLGAGPQPPDWWRKDPRPCGPRGETLVYSPQDVSLLAPLAGYAGTDAELPCTDVVECEVSLAAVLGVPRKDLYNLAAWLEPVAGFTVLARFGARASLGPCLATIDKLKAPGAIEIAVRVNGAERVRFGCSALETELRQLLGCAPSREPGTVIAVRAVSTPAAAGDSVEIEAAGIGVLRNRLATPG